MKAYILRGIGDLAYEDAPVPQLEEGWALVQVSAAGICGSDIPRIFKTGTYHFPTIPGHEFAGKVVDACGGQGKGWIGRRVGVFPLIPCMECEACKQKQYEMCRDYDYLGSRRDGGFAEYVAVPVWNLIEIPSHIGMKEAAMLEPASVSLHAVRRLELRQGDTIALFGLGTIGLLIVQWLHILGIRDVFAVGHNQGHGEMMRKVVSGDFKYKNIGRSQCRDELHTTNEEVLWILECTKGEGAQIVIDCIGSSESLKNCLDSVKIGGQVLAVGNPKGDISLDKDTYWKILRKQIRITGTWNSTFLHTEEDDWHTAIQACSTGELKLAELITHCMPFDKLKQGLDIARGHEEYHNKIMICSDIGTL